MEIAYQYTISLRGQETTHANMQDCIDSLLGEVKRLREEVVFLNNNMDKLMGIGPDGKKQKAYQWYRVLEAWSISGLETAVNNLMLEGWIPCGGMSIATLISNQATFHFYQAMRRAE